MKKPSPRQEENATRTIVTWGVAIAGVVFIALFVLAFLAMFTFSS